MVIQIEKEEKRRNKGKETRKGTGQETGEGTGEVTGEGKKTPKKRKK